MRRKIQHRQMQVILFSGERITGMELLIQINTLIAMEIR